MKKKERKLISNVIIIKLNWTIPLELFLCSLLPVFLLIFNSLYFSAMIVYRVFRHENKFVVKLVHFGLQLVAFCVAVVGLKAAFDYHNSNNISNLYSLHSWSGLITIILFTTQVSFRRVMIHHWCNELASHSGGGRGGSSTVKTSE